MNAKIALLLTLVLGSCACCLTSLAGETPDSPMFTVQEYPRTDGSMSTQPFAVLIACKLTHTSFEVGEMLVEATNLYPTIPQTRTIYPTADSYDADKRFSLAKELKYRAAPKNLKVDLWQKIRHTNTHPSYVNLVNARSSSSLPHASLRMTKSSLHGREALKSKPSRSHVMHWNLLSSGGIQ